jgi:2-iminobutanoate/2-iminopropanoate deaminase
MQWNGCVWNRSRAIWNAPKRPDLSSNSCQRLCFLSGLPPLDPETGDIKPAPFERQVELVLDQMKLCLESVGSSLAEVVKCNVYCTPDPSHFGKFNEIYARYFQTESPARIFLHVPSWPGPFDVEVDCVAVLSSPYR